MDSLHKSRAATLVQASWRGRVARQEYRGRQEEVNVPTITTSYLDLLLRMRKASDKRACISVVLTWVLLNLQALSRALFDRFATPTMVNRGGADGSQDVALLRFRDAAQLLELVWGTERGGDDGASLLWQNCGLSRRTTGLTFAQFMVGVAHFHEAQMI